MVILKPEPACLRRFPQLCFSQFPVVLLRGCFCGMPHNMQLTLAIRHIDNRGVFHVGMAGSWAHRIIYPEIDHLILSASVGAFMLHIYCRIGKCYTFFFLILLSCLKQRQPRYINMLTDPLERSHFKQDTKGQVW